MIRFGLIGNPLTGSGSPALFLQAYGGRWPYDLIETPSFDEAWERFVSGYRAVNVTAPFKEEAYARVLSEGGSVSEDAAATGAVNIVVKTGGERVRLAGCNSDVAAVRDILSSEGFGKGDVAVVAGFGGAGKAAAAAARSLGMDVTVCNRSRREIPDSAGKATARTRPLEELPMLCAVADILVYTLPAAVPELGALSAPAILEANYRTPCLEGAAPRYISGRRWLLEQARSGYALMTGEKPKL